MDYKLKKNKHMKRRNEEKYRASGMTQVAQAQSICCKIVRVGSGLEPMDERETPFRIVDDAPVYHCGYNLWNLRYNYETDRKLHKWGNFYHPFMMVGMPDTGGSNRLYVDNSQKDWYILILLSKLDEWSNGPSYPVWSVLSWTPKKKNDSIVKAGYRMFYASMIAMEIGDVKNSDDSSSLFDEEGDWVESWDCSSLCFHVFASIRATKYENETDFKNSTEDAPPFLMEYLHARKIINSSFK